MHTDRKGRWGWMFFDWATQPFHTLLITFIFAPYFTGFVATDETIGQAHWARMLWITGLIIAITAPVLGALADATGPRKPWIAGFLVLYVLGASALWFATPGMETYIWILVAFSIGIIGLEYATTFNNAMLPEIVPREDVGELSGRGWAFGYVGGLLVLAIMLLFLAENAKGVTLLGIPPILGFDPEAREGTRTAGPITALWLVIFIIPLFLWVPDAPRKSRRKNAVRTSLKELGQTLKRLPSQQSLFAFLGSSMFYRDALNGLYAFGGIFAANVLEWSIVQIGVFGILANITGAIGAWIGSTYDKKVGPKPIVAFCVITLMAVILIILSTSRSSFMGIELAKGSPVPDIVFYICGGIIGAAGGTLQAASRTLMTHQAEPGRMTEGFGLYALSGKATTFLAPASIDAMTNLTGSDRLGVSPLILLFAIGLILLYWVKTRAEAET
ncbi:MFS transporter [Halovulum sp. GXIMD14793]